MSLFSAINVAANALQANQIGLQVVGQNIANAATPGYLREQTNFIPGPTQQVGNLVEGTGVEVQGITQTIDTFLEQQLRNANSDQANTSVTNQTYTQLQGVLNALGSSNLNSDLTGFFSSIAQVLNSPQDPSARNLAVLNGQTVANDFNNLAGQVGQIRTDLNSQVVSNVGNINSLLTQIGDLNTHIAQVTGGGSSASAAVGLTDQRNQALGNLSKLINITTAQQPDGSIDVYVGGQYLIQEGIVRQVQTDPTTKNGIQTDNLAISGSDTPLDITSGQLAGLINSRDQVLGGFTNQINSLAGTLSEEFNKIYSGGQGLAGFTQVTMPATPVNDVNAPLDAAGLTVTPTTGDFQVLVYNTQTGQSQTTTIHVAENGLPGDTTLSSLADQLDGINGLSASVTPQGQLSIGATQPNTQVAFAGDTSGALAAIGLNTFFTGSTAGDLAVNGAVAQNPLTFAASAGGVGVDTQVAQQLANFANLPLASQGGSTFTDLQTALTASVTQQSSVAQSANQASTSFQQSLQNQELSISGVNIDDETVSLLQYQHDYEASARFISTLSTLLDQLVQL